MHRIEIRQAKGGTDHEDATTTSVASGRVAAVGDGSTAHARRARRGAARRWPVVDVSPRRLPHRAEPEPGPGVRVGRAGRQRCAFPRRQGLARVRQAQDIAIAQQGRQDHLLRHGLQVLFDRHVGHLEHADRQRQLPPPPRRCLRLLAGRRRERHDLHGRPRQLAERVHRRPDHQEAHAQVAVQQRARGRHLSTSAHRARGHAGGGHHLLHEQPVQGRGGRLHCPHGQRAIADREVEVQDRQVRLAVFPGDGRERHHLLR